MSITKMGNVKAAIWKLAATASSQETFLDAALKTLWLEFGGSLSMAQGRKGRWRMTHWQGAPGEVSLDALAECLDTESVQQSDGWIAAPVQLRSGNAQLLVWDGGDGSPLEADRLADAATLLKESLESLLRRTTTRRRVDRLEAVLEIAAQWNQAQDVDALLWQMAEASTRLLNAERASVFLWDRRGKTLVGRPALGVEGGELRIPDDKGIVGQVVQTGQSRRVDADDADEQEEIDRAVDEQLKFETRSLLCVPLRGREGQLFGAFELINKLRGNFTDEDETALMELATHAAIALENAQQRDRLVKTRNDMVEIAAEQIEMIGNCPQIEALRSTIGRVADTELAIMILGEHGTGKEVVSQMIHYLSSRRHEPMVAVNCAAVAETLLESELFGHEKGAFTDAHESRAGKFELASGGTLFLDEIGEMSLSGQAKLLRVLEEKIVVRVGGSTPIHADARVVAATNRNLAEMVREKKFREDLFFRLNVLTLELPPLRERGDDILLLAEHFLDQFCTRAGRKTPKFTAAARKRLLGHSWPGNIRELRNLMERLAYLSQGDKVETNDLAFVAPHDDGSTALLSLDLPLAEATRQFQAEYIKQQIERTRGSMTQAAGRLGLHRSNLYRKMRQLGMHTDEPASEADG